MVSRDWVFARPASGVTFVLAMLLASVAHGALFSATLPASRSVQVGEGASFFGTLINASPVTAEGCRVELLSAINAGFRYQAADASNAPVGDPDTPVSIAANGIQSFILTLTANSVIDPTDVQFTFTCDNNGPAPISSGLNTLLFSASSEPTPDMVALAATLTNDGVSVIPPNGVLGLFSVASINLGSAGTLDVSARGTGVPPSALFVCETNPADGTCLAAPAATATTTVDANATPTFAVFLGDTSARIPFDPAGNRVFLEFRENGLIRGATSVAARSTTAQDVYTAEISSDIVQARCVACHVTGGVSGNSRLVFVRSTTPDFQALNQQAFENFITTVPDGADVILQRVRGVAHGGGVQLPGTSEDFANLSTFLDLLGGEVGGSGSAPPQFWSGVSLATPTETLRRAAIVVGRRMPTDAELASVEASGEAALRYAVRGLMSGDGFHDFLIEGADARLHTDAFLEGLFLEVGDLNAGFLLPVGADRYYNDQPQTPEQEAAKWRWVREWVLGISRAPLELIAHVAENDLPYTEILTADYTMVNPIAAEILRSNVSFESNDPMVFKPGQHRGQVLRDDQYEASFVQGFGTLVTSHGAYLDYPHAGVLNSQAFLNRYPSTETNRNRARARWTYLHFLGVDIERSAPRTQDPEALADTNNPTLNNPNCTVCHSVMDPLAGAFQNYDNEGFYRSSNGGLDSLPNTYKHPEWFSEDADPSPYVFGDTWYRDMRLPGLGAATAPNPDNSLAWVAAQIVADPRFATAAIKFWWLPLMGEDHLLAPESSADADFATRLATFEAQNNFIEELGARFASGINGGAPFNARDLLTEMILSPWFRGASAGADAGMAADAKDVGVRRLLTPTELEAKTAALVGWRWGERPADWDLDGVYTSLTDRFKIYYGGIDSNAILTRATALTSLMANVAERQAISMACPTVVLDFDREDGARRLFNGISTAETPVSELGDRFDISAGSYEERQTVSLTSNLDTTPRTIALSFENDYYDEVLGDRNLLLDRLEVRNASDQVVWSLELEDIDSVAGSSYNPDCGAPAFQTFNAWSNCEVSVPFTPPAAGDYEIRVSAYGQLAGPELPSLGVQVSGTNPFAGDTRGALAIKGKLVELHELLLGETLTIDHPEILASYQLLAETWSERRSLPELAEATIAWPQEGCDFPEDATRPDTWWYDPTSMLNAWTTTFIYLLSDFRYLHE